MKHILNVHDLIMRQVEDPSFSLGVTQEATCQEVVIATPIGYAIPPPTV